MDRFPASVVEEAWVRAEGRCECRRVTHRHPGGRCGQTLSGRNWNLHHITIAGPDTLANCELLCAECHRTTTNYQRYGLRAVGEWC